MNNNSAYVVNQSLGGVLIHPTDLGVTAGTVIYGYSLFAPDVSSARPDRLVDWWRSNRFPIDTLESLTGLDLVSSGPYAYTPVPEPATTGICAVGVVALIAGYESFSRRRRQRKESAP